MMQSKLVDSLKLALNEHERIPDEEKARAILVAHRELIAEFERAFDYYLTHPEASTMELTGLWTAIKLIAKGYGITGNQQ